SQISMMYDYVDIFWVGSRNMHNSFLLRAVGEIDKPVILKRGFGATMKEWLMAAEYVLLGGNENVVLIERGIRTFNDWTRATLDISAVPLVKQYSHLPIVVDISHSAGRPDIATGLTAAAIASSADGLMVEVHPNPHKALSDAQQQLTPEQFADVVKTVEYFDQRELTPQI
ncbi:MAG: 3-deoxy-7-phosphoheptulonate synthase, partial [Phototrophicales bacterium]